MNWYFLNNLLSYFAKYWIHVIILIWNANHVFGPESDVNQTDLYLYHSVWHMAWSVVITSWFLGCLVVAIYPKVEIHTCNSEPTGCTCRICYRLYNSPSLSLQTMDHIVHPTFCKLVLCLEYSPLMFAWIMEENSTHIKYASHFHPLYFTLNKQL